MKKLTIPIFLLLFASILSAANQPDIPGNGGFSGTESGEKERFVQLKFGIGADFEGTAGRPADEDTATIDYTMLRNQLGASLGIDFGWIVFDKKEGEGAGTLWLGFGFDIQYWAPTTYISSGERNTYRDSEKIDYIYSHYMRVPVTLNLSYEFRVNAGTLRRTGPLFSFGLNNNIFAFSYNSEDENIKKRLDAALDKNLERYKISGTWSIGLTMVFESSWIINAFIGGDFGNKESGSYLDLYNSEPYKEQSKYTITLYGHHEFLMFETGYRF